ncbi:MAG: 23S rRNA (guanosine(2251)-2'-O)-methyltransferase RlmB [Desulfobacterales bacterium]|nr:23S rRNA (guanosine(2251)-2'-O)-methyltransferase RlmB [Desulfobacterales bacterium]
MAPLAAEILYGMHPLEEALRAGRRRFDALYIRRGRSERRLALIAAEATKRGIPVASVQESDLRQLVGHGGHQGLCARVAPLPVWSQARLLDAVATASRPPFWILLDNLQDPHNLGAIVRTAYCAGADGVVIPRDRAVPPLPSVSKASAGALEHLPVVRVTNLVHLIRQLKKEGLWVAGLDARADRQVFATPLDGPLALVIGGESRGLRRLVKSHCDLRVAIPQARAFDSLNASVAAALAIYEIYRQRLHASGANDA